MSFADWMDAVGTGVEFFGVAVIVGGIVFATALTARDLRDRKDWQVAYRDYRQALGKAILLGLELLVAGDIIRTVSVGPTIEDVAVLGAIVVIRTFLSFALETEITGRPPWRGTSTGGGT